VDDVNNPNPLESNLKSVPKTETIEALRAYPNPFQHGLLVKFSSSVESDLDIYVYDMVGNFVDVIYSGHSSRGIQGYTCRVNSSITPGLYLIKEEMGDYMKTYKVMRK
jgi:hypothetical protein